MNMTIIVMVFLFSLIFPVLAQADLSECTEAWITWPGSKKARLCAVQAVEKLEKEMNDLIKDIHFELRRCSQCSQNKIRFSAAQDAWEKYRNTNCMLEHQGDYPGETSFYLCEARLTEVRVRVLTAYLACQKGDSASCDPWPISSSSKACKE